MATDYSSYRREYEYAGLRRNHLNADPLMQFETWLTQASRAGVIDPTAMTLATVNSAQQPNARIVLLKHFDEKGYVWYTDQSSIKGIELAECPSAALLFYWSGMGRQVRIRGSISAVEVAASDEYFRSRPLNSRIAASVSRQSQPIENRASLERRFGKALAKHVERPERWGGYRLHPVEYEFWQGRENRLHDRFMYRLDDTGWAIQRLQP